MKIVDGKPYIQQIKELIIEYAKWLGRNLSFQNLDDELKDPAKKYTSPEGELLVAVDGEDVLGMIAYHKHSDTRCEMKRLYVKPSCRGMKLGEKLIEELIAHARQAGYKEWCLTPLSPCSRRYICTKSWALPSVNRIITIPCPMCCISEKSCKNPYQTGG